MSTFKYKPKKQIHVKKKDGSVSTTLDMKHREKMSYFEKKKLELPKLMDDLKRCQNKIDEYNIKSYSNFSIKDVSQKSELKDKIKKLEKEISRIKENQEELEYYDSTLNVICDYYSLIEDDDHTKQKKGSDTGVSIMAFLNKKTDKNDEPDKKEDKIINNRATLYESYLLLTNGYSNKKKEYCSIKYCHQCKTEKVLSHSDGMYICMECGDCEMAIVDSDRPNYKDPTKDTSTYAYKRINHFNEWLNQFQAKESTEIPKDVYDSILTEINRLRITNLGVLNPDKMRKILKKLRLNKYYEHIPHIINKLNGLPPPKLSRETERQLRKMFRDIQEPFAIHKPKGRKNFISYSYILHKFCELLELDEFLPCFTLLKSHEKLSQQDKVWKKICQHVNWEFYPSC
jgi:hypothetical protein